MKTRALLALAVTTAVVGSAPAMAMDWSDYRPLNLFLKVGAGRYTQDYTNYTGYGPTWGVGLGLQPLSFLGFEIAYDGAHHTTQGALFPDINGQPGILRSGGSILVKLSAPIQWFRPFIGAGFGVDWLSPTGPSTSFLQGSLAEELPLAAGIEFIAGPVIIGGRFTYRFLFNDAVILDPARSSVHGALADVQVTVGVRL